MSNENNKPTKNGNADVHKPDMQRDISDDTTRIYTASNKEKDTVFSSTTGTNDKAESPSNKRDIGDDTTRLYAAANKEQDTTFSSKKNNVDKKEDVVSDSGTERLDTHQTQPDVTAEHTRIYVASNINQDTQADKSEQKENQSADPWTQSSVESRSTKGTGGSGGGAGGGGGSGGGGNSNGPDGNWERDILNRLAFATLNEQRRARRWGVFFKFLAFVYVGAVLFYLPADMGQGGISGGKHTAIIDIEGPIAADTIASADNIVSGLRAAFKNKNTAGIILRINSPGGSPVQAGYVYDEIKRLREAHQNIKLYAVITDMCASGGYYIAAAADEIYADKASIVGSIGVLMNGFGFTEAMKKLGVERRLMTAGEHKGVLDPFSPVKKEEEAHVQSLLNGVHQQFINVVKNGRGDRLKDHPDLFTGLFWNGEEGMELGLVDGLGSTSYVAREIIGVEKLVDFSPRMSYLDRFADRIGATFARVMINTLGMQAVGIK